MTTQTFAGNQGWFNVCVLAYFLMLIWQRWRTQKEINGLRERVLKPETINKVGGK